MSSKAVELYRQEVTDIGARKRFKAGPGYVEQFLAKTRTRHLVLSREQEPQEEQEEELTWLMGNDIDYTGHWKEYRVVRVAELRGRKELHAQTFSTFKYKF